jgi:DNA primase
MLDQINAIAKKFPDAEVHGDEVWADCPFCNDSRKNLWMNPKLGCYRCWKCDEKGRLETLLSSTIPSWSLSSSKQATHPSTMVLPPEYLKLDIYSGKAWTYFVSRRFDASDAERFGVGYCPRGQYYGRLILPVWDEGKLVSFVARDYTGNTTVKIRNPSNVPHKSYLYNYDLITNSFAVLVEGIFDCWRVGDDGVATFGTSLSVGQMLRLCKLNLKRLYFCWDEDALDKAYEASFLLRQFIPEVHVVELPVGKDPADLDRTEVWEHIEESKPINLKRYISMRLLGSSS